MRNFLFERASELYGARKPEIRIKEKNSLTCDSIFRSDQLVKLRACEYWKPAEVSRRQIDPCALKSTPDVRCSIDGDAAAKFRITAIAQHGLLEQRHVWSCIEDTCRSPHDGLCIVPNVPCKAESRSNQLLVTWD